MKYKIETFSREIKTIKKWLDGHYHTETTISKINSSTDEFNNIFITAGKVVRWILGQKKICKATYKRAKWKKF